MEKWLRLSLQARWGTVECCLYHTSSEQDTWRSPYANQAWALNFIETKVTFMLESVKLEKNDSSEIM